MARVWDESKVNRDELGQFAELDVPGWLTALSGRIGGLAARDKAGFKPGRWREASRDEEVARLALDMYQGAIEVQPDYPDKNELRQICLDEAELHTPNTDRRVVKNGDFRVMVDSSTLTDDEVADLTELIDDLQVRFPAPPHGGSGRIVHVVDQSAFMVDDHADAQTVHGAVFIKIRAKVWRTEKSASDGFMPSQDDNPRWKYAIAHEWGHAVDDAEPLQQLMAQFDEESMGLSAYGQSKPREAYAEAFAEWYLTRGRTTNRAARFYAQKFGWGEPW